MRGAARCFRRVAPSSRASEHRRPILSRMRVSAKSFSTQRLDLILSPAGHFVWTPPVDHQMTSHLSIRARRDYLGPAVVGLRVHSGDEPVRGRALDACANEFSYGRDARTLPVWARR